MTLVELRSARASGRVNVCSNRYTSVIRLYFQNAHGCDVEADVKWGQMQRWLRCRGGSRETERGGINKAADVSQPTQHKHFPHGHDVGFNLGCFNLIAWPSQEQQAGLTFEIENHTSRGRIWTTHCHWPVAAIQGILQLMLTSGRCSKQHFA